MTSILYLLRKSIKNSLLQLLKKPAKLIMYILILAAIVALAVLPVFTEHSVEDLAPLFWFTGAFFLFVAMFFAIGVSKGLSKGDTIFDMSDVNLLFVSPVNPRKILIYGIVKLVKTSFLGSFFILFQSGTMANFGVHLGGLVLIMLMFIMGIVATTIMSLFIYSFANGKPRRKNVVKLLTIALFLPLALFMVFQLIEGQGILTVLEHAIKSPHFIFIPIVGWTAQSTALLLSGEMLQGLLFIGANLLLSALFITYIALSKADFYEDSLCATETAFEKKRAIAEGNLTSMQASGRKIKVAKTGISGKGSSALFSKHLRESFRQNRFGFLSLSSVLIIVGSIALSIIARNDLDLTTTLQILMWIQIILIGTGRGLVETYSHYIYMIPETSFSKIIWSNFEIFFKTFVESVLIFAISGLIMKSSLFVILGCIAAFTLFSVLLLGINYLSMRVLSANMGTGLMIMIYYLLVIIFIAPGLTVALIVGFNIGGTLGTVVGLGILSAWELLIGLVCFALSKSVLHNCDMPAKPSKT